ncbi:MAG: SPOR domain-containing protein [Mongoliibacter sp.]|uniref:SPOR domain-containing protein n=1 Tax=Mongoliibacter sp. TaxID=2022438 RepID=UPI0012EFEDB0|nr:SPOR domain-containing protein [Mongoliibacter sp.]TVP47604.1 MAG: SPOR domain-containing protein [Mongoliibacter sp.]
MSSKEPDKNIPVDDKDYGFPFVEVTPLSSATPKKEEKLDKITDPKPVKDNVEVVKASVGKGLINPSTGSPKRPRKQSPVLLSLVLLILVILGVMAYFLYYMPATEKTDSQERFAQENSFPTVVEPSTPEAVEEPTEVIDEETMTEEPDEAVEEESIPRSTPASSSSISPGNLEIVSSPGDRAVYFIIVGSMPNERLAREEADKLLQKGKNLYLLMPHGETKNYRLSIGSYTTFSSASQALEEAKTEFDESTWILKY